MTLGERAFVVTGSASGIGRATAQRLLDAGARVVGMDVARGSPTAGAYEHVECDVGDESSVERAVDDAVVSLGRTTGSSRLPAPSPAGSRCSNSGSTSGHTWSGRT